MELLEWVFGHLGKKIIFLEPSMGRVEFQTQEAKRNRIYEQNRTKGPLSSAHVYVLSMGKTELRTQEAERNGIFDRNRTVGMLNSAHAYSQL